MKILVVSHNAMGSATNMGKTILSYFREFSGEELAQFYIRCEVPAKESPCRNFYRFTDRDAIKSIFSLRPCGTVFRKEEIRTEQAARKDTGLFESVYQYGRKRTAVIYALRNALWRGSRWKTKQLWQWVEDFDPDVVFFASGDYGFMYDIAGEIAAHARKPLVVSCVDDFYFYNRNDGVFGRMVHRSFLKTVRSTMARADGIFTICPAMRYAYEALFGKKCHVLYTAAERKEIPENHCSSGIAYLGNLGLKRNGQLAEIGRILKTMDIPGIPKYIDVYSGERNPEILKMLTPENGIRFHGRVPAEQVEKILQNSTAVIHTESFAPELRDRIRFSISTKIAESLMHGPCLIAYGPEGIASMDYLKENGAAYTITNPEHLAQGLREILTDAELRREIVGRARKLAEANHSTIKMRQRLTEICEKHNENSAN